MPDAERRRFGGVVRLVYDRFLEHQSATYAAALAFCAMLSAVPLLSVAVAVLARVVGGSGSARGRLESAMAHFMPGAGATFPRLIQAMQTGSGAYGLLGLFSLLLTGAAVFATLEVAFNRIWEAEKPRGWFRSRINALFAAVGVLVLLLCSVLSTSLVAVAQATEVPGLHKTAGEIEWLWRYSQLIGPMGLSVAVFTLLYKIVPNCRVTVWAALRGGILAGILWELAKIAFTYYLAHSASYNRVYGPLAGMAVGMVWVYYSSVVVLVGAEIAALGRRRAEDQAGPAS